MTIPASRARAASKAVGQQEHLHGPAVAGDARQQDRRRRLGEDAEIDERKAEDGVGGGVDDVAMEQHRGGRFPTATPLTAATTGTSTAASASMKVRAGATPPSSPPSAKVATSLPLENESPLPVIQTARTPRPGVGAGQGPRQGRVHFRVQRVLPGGPVQAQLQDAAVAFLEGQARS